jgi:transcriptional regulator with XRE-family HTH domain
MDVGAQIKKLRKEKGYTLRKLAGETGLSTGFLHNVENDINSPTISSLWKICRALNVNIYELLQPDSPLSRTVRKSERVELFHSAESRMKYELLSSPDIERYLRAVLVSIEPGGSYGDIALGHASPEFGLVLAGSLEVEVAGETYIIEAGDTIFIESNAPHRIRNAGTIECQSYWVVLTP